MFGLLALIASSTTAVADHPAVLAGIELRAAPRISLTAVHPLGDWAALAETLTVGLGRFPDLELRAALHEPHLAPVAPWVAIRFRRIDLEELPPLESYVSFGLAFSSSLERWLSLDAGAGLRLQLPPLSAEAASDLGTYLAENVSVELFFGARVRLW
ncbi:MAG: hypothetical protein IT384_02885 [Deltaproteobacteria bacterium]|nr:hypothetical protein [Deltaproteobacteria bacterium]